MIEGEKKNKTARDFTKRKQYFLCRINKFYDWICIPTCSDIFCYLFAYYRRREMIVIPITENILITRERENFNTWVIEESKSDKMWPGISWTRMLL